jgi:hypothetical protein
LREKGFKILAGVLAAIHWQEKPDAPHSPSVSFNWHSLFEIRWIADLPKDACPTSVRRNYECISRFARFCFPVSDFAESEAIDNHVIKNDESMIDRCTGAPSGRATNAGPVGDALAVLESIAKGRPR